MVLRTEKSKFNGKLFLQLLDADADDDVSQEIDLYAIQDYPQIAKAFFYLERTAGTTDIVEISLEFSMRNGANWSTITAETMTITSSNSPVTPIIEANKIGRYVRIKVITVGITGNTHDIFALIA